MNTIVTSREDILQSAKKLAVSEGLSELSMRALAKECGIAVGSIYNYFPTKTDLTIAVVADVWQEIFHPSTDPAHHMHDTSKISFLAFVGHISKNIKKGLAQYPGFFQKHAISIDDKTKGHEVMTDYFNHMKNALHVTLLNDKSVRQTVWSETFAPRDFSDFVFDFLLTDLTRGIDRSEFLKELIKKLVL